MHITSTDGAAVLPADFAYTAASVGVHTFSATLTTAGAKSITATDGASLTGTQGPITVSAAGAAKLFFTTLYPSPTTHGVSHTFTVTARDAFGNVATGYRGTVHFTSSDAAAVLPANYIFTATDSGVHTFSATLNTVGTQSITVTSTLTSSITGTQTGISVT